MNRTLALKMLVIGVVTGVILIALAMVSRSCRAMPSELSASRTTTPSLVAITPLLKLVDENT